MPAGRRRPRNRPRGTFARKTILAALVVEVRYWRGHLFAVGTNDAHRFGRSAGEGDVAFDYVFARNGELVVDDDGCADGLGIESGADSIGGTLQDSAKLVHGNGLIVPCVFVSLRRGCAGDEVMELAAHHQRPSVGEPILRIGATAQPDSGD